MPFLEDILSSASKYFIKHTEKMLYSLTIVTHHALKRFSHDSL